MGKDHVSLGNPSGAMAANVLGIFLELGGRLNHSTKGQLLYHHFPIFAVGEKASSTASSEEFSEHPAFSGYGY